ncbi:MAG: hypothetical protein NTW50_01535 [Candidatus Berkelbacteria bacterium]|nr:hypothetical protein [Candidatus Berkelbacteria bacterium]
MPNIPTPPSGGSNKPSLDGLKSKISVSRETANQNLIKTPSQEDDATQQSRLSRIKPQPGLGQRLLNFVTGKKAEEEPDEDETPEDETDEDEDEEAPFGQDLDTYSPPDRRASTPDWANPERFAKEAEKKEDNEKFGTPVEASGAKPKEAPTNALPEEAVPGGKSIATSPNANLQTVHDSATGDQEGRLQAVADSRTGKELKNFRDANQDQDKKSEVRQRAQATATQAADKAKKEVERKVWQKIWAWVAANAWWIILIILGIVILWVGISWVMGAMKSSGGSPVQATKSVADRDWLSKFMLYAGDKDTKKALDKQFVDDISTALVGLQGDPKVDADTKTKAKQIETDLKEYSNPSITAPRKEALGKEIIQLITDITNKFSGCKTIINDSFFLFNQTDKDSFNSTGKLANGAYINPLTCLMLQKIKDNSTTWGITAKQITVLFQGDHSTLTTSGNLSQHMTGDAMDLNTVSGANETTFSKNLADWIHSSESTLKPLGLVPYQAFFGEYVQGNYNQCQKVGTAADFDKHNHIHIGFKDKCKN